jgi:hypothetical protein
MARNLCINAVVHSKCKSPGSNRIAAEHVQAGGETLLSAIHRLRTCIWNKEELIQEKIKRRLNSGPELSVYLPAAEKRKN